MIELLLFLIAILLLNYVIFLFKIINGLNKLSNNVGKNTSADFISVIIPFRNETENILTSLESLTSQNIAEDKYEIIYVNDSSTDDSLQKLYSVKKPANVKVISFFERTDDKAYKKKAINFGIAHSLGEIIVTTDADCIHSRNWLNEMTAGFDENTALVSGPVSFMQEENLFSKIQTIEFAGLVLAGAGLIGAGMPTICNGANLAFRKSIFQKLKGYKEQLHLSSGEDEIFMQKISKETKYSVKLCNVPDAVVLTKSNKSFKEFFQQRKRWASKGLFYKNKFLVVLLALIYLFYVGLFAQIFFFLFVSKYFLISLFVCLTVKFILEYKIISKGAGFLFDNSLLKYFMITELFQISYLLAAGIAGVFGNFKWKERKLKR